MTRILANDENLAMAPNNLALLAHLLYRRTYLHRSFPFGGCLTCIYLYAAAAGVLFSILEASN